MTNYIHSSEVFEKDQQDLVWKLHQELFQVAGTFLDVGAHVGHWSTYIGKNFHRVVAVEASPENWDELDARTAYPNNVIVVRKAAMDVCGSIRIKKHYSRSKDPYYKGMRCYVNTQGEYTVDCDTLDHICEEIVPDITLIKMDIEGMEPVAWLGMRQIIRKSKPLLIFEIEDRWLGRARKYLKPRGDLDGFSFRMRVCDAGYVGYISPDKPNDTIFIPSERLDFKRLMHLERV